MLVKLLLIVVSWDVILKRETASIIMAVRYLKFTQSLLVKQAPD